MTVLQNWNELKADIEDLYNNKNFRIMYEQYKNTYPIILEVVAELENNPDKYIAEPTLFSKFIFSNETYSKSLYEWLPYLSGARAQLLEMKFYDQNNKEIVDKSHISEAIKSNDLNITSNTFISIEPNLETLTRFSQPAKKLKI